MQIRLSSVVLAALLGVGLVAGLIAFSPALTRMYYVHLALLILGAGACVTLYNRRAAHRVRPRADAASLAFEEDPDGVHGTGTLRINARWCRPCRSCSGWGALRRVSSNLCRGRCHCG